MVREDPTVRPIEAERMEELGKAEDDRRPGPRRKPEPTTPLAEPAPVAPKRAEVDLTSPAFYLNRELTWLAFNQRLLREAQDETNPLLERVKFLAIVSANLDEFYMKRIGGLKQQVAAGVREPTVDGRTPAEQIEACYQIIAEIDRRRREIFVEVRKSLRKAGIHLAEIDELSHDERRQLREQYLKNVYPLVTPQAMDPAHPFPFISNLSLNLLITLRYPKDATTSMARVKVPVGSSVPRWMRLGDSVFVALEDVMADNLDLLFPGMEVETKELFRVVRNANTERDEEDADDLLALIETELRDRKFAPIVRMQVGKGMSSTHRGMLAAELGLDAAVEVPEVDERLGLADLWEIANLDIPALHDPPHHPIDNPDLTRHRNMFHVIRDAGSILLQHPYESFSSSVERFLQEASEDPKVRAIKMTLYRTSAETQVIDHLIEAARNGKQVAVVVELKARFDEGANIQWAERLEEYGIHVTYGVVGLKTHCKVILVVRQDYNGLRRYAHIGTGNYHSGTARIYADLGLLTSDPGIGQDLTELFNYLTTGYKPRRKYLKILPAPTALKPALLEKIAREASHAAAGRKSGIQMKMNALEDVDVVRALYEASNAGVPIDLIVRDTCRLRPGIKGVSENIRVVSIVGRFLEHSRITYFENGGTSEYFIGSADCMKRNLESRVEVMTPVEDPHLRQELRKILDLQLGDTEGAWEMKSDGTYVKRLAKTPGPDAQHLLIEWADKRLRESSRLRRRKPKGIARRLAR